MRLPDWRGDAGRWISEASRILTRTIASLEATKQTIRQPVPLPSYTVANLPSPEEAGVLVFVTDEAGGAVPAFSDGSDWRRCTDRAVVS